jgi:hypothetical protein
MRALSLVPTKDARLWHRKISLLHLEQTVCESLQNGLRDPWNCFLGSGDAENEMMFEGEAIDKHKNDSIRK